MSESLPASFREVGARFPEVAAAYAALGAACAQAGPLDAHTVRLVKLALAIGAGSEGATHSHTRRSLAEGSSREELSQVAILAIPTLGFPRAVAALSWINDIVDSRP